MPSTERVSFKSRELKVAGTLYKPEGSGKLPAVVVAHPMTGVKEQTSGLHAKLLAEKGFVALAFDAAYQGESEGQPRFLEDPSQRAQDVRAAVSFLQSLDFVDPERIGALGICASGGYVPFAAQTDARIKAVATVSAACAGSLFRDGLPTGPVSEQALQENLKNTAKVNTDIAKGGKSTAVDILPEDTSALPKDSMFKEAPDYYKTPRAQHPNAPNKFDATSMTFLGNYDSYAFNYMISPRPLLMVAGSKADTKFYSERAILNAKEPRELFVVPDRTHIDLYDKIDVSGPKLVEFFQKNL
ncbi:hypothetical protein MPSI1_000689 [Malassezia psittaci]|uniref:Dienelactone hydrolase domain-containing protein n=1 Tax=Malassezia psittaci TaxID=1821823 RepID=A0AAF0FC49_9BASI|nr:hypothetical protein MPSI1_000689 [Malassezia psittaci]